ncbi:zinc-binding dehydrogenase [Streptomyces sp. NPDC002755]
MLRLESADVAEPGPGEVKIRQEAVGVNFFDTMLREGKVGGSLPMTLGSEAAGVVEAAGAGAGTFTPGDRVGYFATAGAYTSERIIAADALIRIPDTISSRQAAAFLAKGFTAWMGLRSLHQISAGEVVLVQGASGSVGSILSRWARAQGAIVIGVAGSESKLEKVRAGADYALYAGDPEFLTKVHSVARPGVDVVFDFVGQATAHLSAAAVRSGGKIAAIGAASGQGASDSEDLAKRNVSVVSGSVPQHVNAQTVGKASAELFQALEEGLFNDLPITGYALRDAARAHQDMAARALSGIPVLLV